MKVTIDTNHARKKDVVERMMETPEGRFASLLDEALYSADTYQVCREGSETFKYEKFGFPTELRDRLDGYKAKDTKKFFTELRDFLYQRALEEIV